MFEVIAPSKSKSKSSSSTKTSSHPSFEWESTEKKNRKELNLCFAIRGLFMDSVCECVKPCVEFRALCVRKNMRDNGFCN